jgi:protein O-GlcNAc transferase
LKRRLVGGTCLHDLAVCEELRVAATIDQAILDYQAGRIAAAEAAVRTIGTSDPDYPAALHLRSLIACDRGRADEALGLIDRALALRPDSGVLLNARARALVGLDRPEEAEAAYRHAFAVLPQAMQIANNLGCLLRDRGDLPAAIAWFARARQLAPDSPEVACNLAEALAAQGRDAESVVQFRHALSLRPGSAEVLAKFGHMLLTRGNLRAARECYEAALRQRPDDPASHNNLGVIYQHIGESDRAACSFRTALDLDGNFADAHYNLGCLLGFDNRGTEARQCHDRAIAANPLHGAARWARCMAELPVLYETQAEIAIQRARYAQQLDVLAADLSDPAIADALRSAIGACQPFFLPYQGACDRDLQARYGEIITRLLGATRVAPAPPPARGERIRVGIVSGYFCEHTIWRLMLKGWLAQVDRRRFSVHAYHTGLTEDAQTAIARRTADTFARGTATDLRAAIIADRPHVLIYPELGMDATSARLAGERLARVQCVAWGQPQTSGLPTIDVFLTGDLMEPPDGASHYTERLVRLPNLGIHYTPDERRADPCTRRSLGLRDDATVFWCGQALYKYLPQYDDIFVRIAERVPGCQFLFIGFAKSAVVTARFRERLRRAFAARDLDADRHCIIVPPMPQERFLATIRCADLMLDSIGWSGGRSTLDSLAETPVIVTLAGDLMRGRHTAAILTRIGVPGTIAATIEEYIDIATRLALDPAERACVRERMATGIHRVMADVASVRGLEDFLEKSVLAAPEF